MAILLRVRHTRQFFVVSQRLNSTAARCAGRC